MWERLALNAVCLAVTTGTVAITGWGLLFLATGCSRRTVLGRRGRIVWWWAMGGFLAVALTALVAEPLSTHPGESLAWGMFGLLGGLIAGNVRAVWLVPRGSVVPEEQTPQNSARTGRGSWVES
jgi:MFS family permease